MTLYLRPPTYPRWCRLRDAGGPSHYTACGARISASDAVLITGSPGEVCEACRAADVSEREAIAKICCDVNGQTFPASEES